MREDYRVKKTDDKYYMKLSYTGETLKQAKERINKKRLAKIRKNRYNKLLLIKKIKYEDKF